MISGNKFSTILFFLLLYFQNPLFSQVALTVTYPKEGQEVTASDSSFIFGIVSNPDARVSINQHPAKLYKNGTFLEYLPVQPDSFVFHCLAIFNADTIEVNRKVFIPGISNPIPADSFAIDTNYVFPQTDLELMPGDYLKVAFKATPAKEASFSLPGIIATPVKMLELPPSEEGYWGEAVFGVGHAIYKPAMPGVYHGIFKIPANQKPDSGAVHFELMEENGTTISATSKGQVIILNDSRPIVAEIVQDGTVGRTGPGLGYNMFFEKGIQVVVNGKYKGYYKLNLNEDNTVWVPESSLRFLPKGTPSPFSNIAVVRADDLGDKVRIKLYLQNKLPYKIEQDNERGTLLISVFKATANTDWIRNDFKSSFIREMLWQQPENDLYQLKVVFNASQQWGYDTHFDGNVLTIDVKKPPKDFSLKNMMIVVDPGHGPLDGSIGPSFVPEKNATLDLALVLKKKLVDKGAKVYLTRFGQHGANLRVRAKLAHYLDADLFLSLHYNALPDGVNPFKSRGSSTFYYQPQSRPLAAFIQKELIKKLKLPNFGLYYDNLYVCRITQMPSVLIEPAFMMHPEEEMKILNLKFRKRTAGAIVKGIQNFLKAAKNNRKF